MQMFTDFITNLQKGLTFLDKKCKISKIVCDIEKHFGCEKIKRFLHLVDTVDQLNLITRLYEGTGT